MTARITARRRLVKRVGLALLVGALGTTTACIFEKGGDYKGGGRLGDITATASGSSTTEPTTTTTTSTTDSGSGDGG